MGKVVDIGCVTKLDIPADKVLESNIGLLSGVVIMGYDKEGNEVFASTYADGGDVLWLLERCKQELFQITGDTA